MLDLDGGYPRLDAVALTRTYADHSQEIKRAFDIIGALLILCLCAPFMVLIYLSLLFSGGNPIYVDMRLGKDGRDFRCYKFRSMVNDADRVLADYLGRNPVAREEWIRSVKLTSDPRVTLLGTFLRKHSFDELPQLFNVLKGDMSLVGPRPIKAYEVDLFPELYCRCRPGLTGLWQVSGRNNLDYDARSVLNRRYARERTLWLDIVIVFRTVGAVVNGRGAY